MQEPAFKIRKRVREACEPCRRKKGRCGGEKPVCSLCARLEQQCSYAGNSRESSFVEGTEDRAMYPQTHDGSNEASCPWQEDVQHLDSKITEVLDQVRVLANQQMHARLEESVMPTMCATNLPLPLGTSRRAAGFYLKFCHCQPLPLFDIGQFEATILSRDIELQLALAGVALRFDVGQRNQQGNRSDATEYLERARSMIMARISQGNVELSTLQSLCLLVLANFNEGKPQQAGVCLALVTDLARSARLDLYGRQVTSNSRTDEYVRCLWSVIMLQYLCGGVGVITSTIDVTDLRSPPSDGINELASANKQNSSTAQPASYDLGVVAYAAQMTEAWYRVRQYVRYRGKLDRHPPWSGQSMYASIISRQMELESQMPHNHRFNPSGFAEHTVLTLSTNRHYWAPWLYLQIVYHSIVCTLNHPLLLSIHLRRFRVNQIPELFLQHTSDMITSHTDWVIHLIDTGMQKQFEFSDPFLGQCVAIIATIFLQQSYTRDEEARLDKQGKYSICLQFVKDLGRFWPHVEEMAIDLQNFENTVSKAFESSSTDPSADMSKTVDLSTFWRILDNSQYSSMSVGARSIFGPSLRLHPGSRADAEMLSTRLLPEPTRVHSLPHMSGSVASTPTARYTTTVQGSSNVVHGTSDYPAPAGEVVADSPFLTQNFFSLGQDFVGNVDDWFNWSEM